MDVEQFRAAGYSAIDRICEYYSSIQDRPVTSHVEPGYLRKALPSSAPDNGEDFETITADYQKLVVPGLTHWQHPSFFAYFPAACTFEGILGDLYSSSTANPGFNWLSSPACTELEAVVMDWAAKLFGLSPAFLNTTEVGGGVIMTSASDACLTAVVAARSSYVRTHPGVHLEDLVIYTTTQTHSIGVKTALVLGLTVRALDVTSEDDFSLKGATLQAALEEDVRKGRIPFILIATVGTTSSGAIDDIDEIGQVAHRHPSLWIHIDAAWAGVALACPEFRETCKLDAINRYAHSLSINFHKWGLTNFDTSTLWVRDRRQLTEALNTTPVFLRTKQSDAGTVIEYRHWHLGLGRRFRSLKLWFVLRSFGVEGFREHIRRGVRLNNQFVSLLRSSPQFEILAPPSLALTVFRLKASALDATSPPLPKVVLNDLNLLFFDRLSARDDILLTQTVLNDVVCVRFAVGAERTRELHVEKAFEVVCQEGELAAISYLERLGGDEVSRRRE